MTAIKIRYCNECSNSILDINDIVTYGDNDYNVWCLECALNVVNWCYMCDVNLSQDNLWFEDEAICQSCYDENIGQCDGCSETYHKDNDLYHWLEDTDETLCDNCYSDSDAFTCDDCDRTLSGESYEGNGYCDDCYSDSMSYCDDCDSDYNSNEYSGCPDCSGAGLYQYSYKPEPIFYGTIPADKLYFGMELELSGGDRAELVKKTVELFGDMVYCKKDGSVASGYEIVTHPINAREFNTIFNADNLKELASMGGRSWDSNYECGIHISLSKKAFTPKHKYAFTKLMFDNENFFTNFSGRNSTYARFTEKDNGQSPAIKYAKGDSNDNRYLAINGQNADTLEVRIFKGTLNPVRVRRNVEILLAMYDFTKIITVKNIINNELTIENFIEYVNSNRISYPNLITHNLFVKEVN